MSSFIVHDLVQGSQEWLDFRKGKIGASDVAAILGLSPWETKLQIWERMHGGKTKEKNEAMQRGNDLEPEALSAANMMFSGGAIFLPTVLQSKKNPDLIASLDGYREWMGIREILEIKCPGEEDHSIAQKNKIPEKYYPQLQHQMMIACVPYATYFSYRNKEGVIVRITRDDKFIEGMLSQELAFIDSLMRFVKPEPTDRDWMKIRDFKAISDVEKYFELDAIIKDLSQKRDFIKDSLKSISNHPRLMIGNAKLQKIEREGTIDYSKAEEDGICLEKYRKPPTESWRLSIFKQ